MIKPGVLCVALAAAVLPAAAFAQPSASSDIAYCNKLADTYVRYVGHDENSPRRAVTRGTTDAQVAVTQCRQGQTASAIPVLERELRRAGFTLPLQG